MKSAFLVLISIFSLSHSFCQYFYKDIIVPSQTAARLNLLKQQKIKSVKVASFESDGQPTPDFKGTQSLTHNFSRLSTELQSALSGSSELTSFFNPAGQLIKTIDTTDGSGSVTEYEYNDKGLLVKVINISTSGGQRSEKEAHVWYYNSSGTPEKMHRIKNETDSTYISFVTDEAGNVLEENSSKNGTALPPVYYYYDDKNRLTDIVRYNEKAGRLLPDYIFEYNAEGQLVSMLIRPEGDSEYQKWQYEYDEKGLKTKETCYNKQRQLLGRIEYNYN